jgi:hypothetical protein
VLASTEAKPTNVRDFVKLDTSLLDILDLLQSVDVIAAGVNWPQPWRFPQKTITPDKRCYRQLGFWSIAALDLRGKCPLWPLEYGAIVVPVRSAILRSLLQRATVGEFLNLWASSGLQSAALPSRRLGGRDRAAF